MPVATHTGPLVLSGRKASAALRERIKAEAADVKARRGHAPHLAAVLVGEDPASQTYVRAKVKACEEVGFLSSLIELPAAVLQDQLLEQVQDLNSDGHLDGFIVQLPLPEHLDADQVTLAIDPAKDVDGFHPQNVGRMVLGQDTLLPATPSGILELLRYYNVQTAGKHCVVIGRSNIVGTPMSILMSRNAYPGNCTVTIAHSRTRDLRGLTRSADILIVALGHPEFITAGMIKPCTPDTLAKGEGPVVIDVGIHRVSDATKKRGFRLVGDVKANEVAPLCSAISPVPGGVGPMTITSLLLNTLKAANSRS